MVVYVPGTGAGRRSGRATAVGRVLMESWCGARHLGWRQTSRRQLGGPVTGARTDGDVNRGRGTAKKGR